MPTVATDLFTHVIWTVHGHPLPQAAWSPWQQLAKLYSEQLGETSSAGADAHPIASPDRIPQPTTAKHLPPERASQVQAYILELASPAGDRVAGGLGVQQLAVCTTHVQLLLDYAGDDMHQKLSRLKSRSAHFTGPKTWSKGFFLARHTSPEARRVLSAYISALTTTSQTG